MSGDRPIFAVAALALAAAVCEGAPAAGRGEAKLQGHATYSPTNYPTLGPTMNPTTWHPTFAPTLDPTVNPTTVSPTFAPTDTPTTNTPSISPTAAPSITGPKVRKLNFTDQKRCSLPYCDDSLEYRIKFSRRLDAECFFHTPVIPNSPLIVWGVRRRDRYEELANRIAAHHVVCCTVILEDKGDDWDYVKDMMTVANEIKAESKYSESVYVNTIGDKVGFMGVLDAASYALMTKQMWWAANEYLDPAFNYTGFIALSPEIVPGAQQSLWPNHYTRIDPPIKSDATPLLVMAGSADCSTPPKSNALRIYGKVEGCKTYVELVGGSHCYYTSNRTLVEREEGYNGWRVESYQEDLESCLMRERQCLAGRTQRQEQQCLGSGSDCAISMDPEFQRNIMGKLLGNWVRFAYLDDWEHFGYFTDEVLARKAQGHVRYFQRGCEYPNNLP